jgi:hypothetical protein
MITLRQRTRQDGVSAESTMTDPPSEDSFDADWYRVTLKRGRRQLTTPFGMGRALCREPTAEDVLQSLLSDASSADESFEDWCGEYGYDTDSRKAERTYQQVQTQTAKLRAFLGDDFEAYMYETDNG